MALARFFACISLYSSTVPITACIETLCSQQHTIVPSAPSITASRNRPRGPPCRPKLPAASKASHLADSYLFASGATATSGIHTGIPQSDTIEYSSLSPRVTSLSSRHLFVETDSGIRVRRTSD
ncbi:hypothetical protein PHSY_004987 [Pseudozyma hubeiensis SY62]|uniref:Secreted protein n=1 Tax=Pseudozyma hubeiensis (strain SY62) TaxID=1305764 RepID=R9P839_PSEHS|nr:hypothetical protein PHSY_004987 [Pseudozyma hubeiensis SY62]GAC97402.1 hypothetical protein PHSY_004987 [Pseudozyma hubeiensis SY62]